MAETKSVLGKARAKFIELYSRVIKKEGDKDDSIFYNGENNLYPNEIELAILNSPSGKNASKMFAKFVSGKGVENDIVVNEEKNYKLSKIVKIASTDISRQNGVYFHVGQRLDDLLELVPVLDILEYTKVRIGKEDDNDNITKYWFKDCAKTKSFLHKENKEDKEIKKNISQHQNLVTGMIDFLPSNLNEIDPIEKIEVIQPKQSPADFSTPIQTLSDEYVYSDIDIPLDHEDEFNDTFCDDLLIPDVMQNKIDDHINDQVIGLNSNQKSGDNFNPQDDGYFVDVEIIEPKKNKSEKKPKKPKPAKQPTDGSKVYEAYNEAYQKKYNQTAPRNAKVNALCSQLVTRLGLDDAIKVVQFYLTHNDSYYVRNLHMLSCAVIHAEKLLVESNAGVKITGQMAQRNERLQNNLDVVERFMKREREKAKIDEELKAIF